MCTCVTAQGFKAKVTFFASHGLTGQARTCFAALTEITNTSAPKVIILKVCSVLSKLHLSYISSEHTYTQCETTPNCAHCCLSWFTLNAPERQDRGSTLKTAEWQQLRITSVWGKVSLVLFYSHTNAIGLPFGVQKTVGNSLVELLSQCWGKILLPSFDIGIQWWSILMASSVQYLRHDGACRTCNYVHIYSSFFGNKEVKCLLFLWIYVNHVIWAN